MGNATGSIAVRSAAKRARYEVAQGVLEIINTGLSCETLISRVQTYCEQFEPVLSGQRKERG